MKRIIFLLAFLLVSGRAFATELTIGLIPEQNVFKQVERYEPLGQYIEEKTGIKIKFTILSRYGNIIENFHKKKLDGAFWGSFTGAMAIKKLNIDFIARPVNEDGNSTYSGYIFVRKDSGIKNIADMKGRTVAFVERATTAGYVFPIAYFKEQGISNINTYFREYYFAGSHDAAIAAVLNRKAEVGCAKNSMFDRLAKNDPHIKDELVVITESPHVPSNGLGLRKEIAFGVKAEIKRALLDMDKDPRGRQLLAEFGALSFVETKEADYQPVFDMAKRAGIDLEHYEYTNQ